MGCFDVCLVSPTVSAYFAKSMGWSRAATIVRASASHYWLNERLSPCTAMAGSCWFWNLSQVPWFHKV